MVLTALILLALLVWLWQDTQRARERAILTARRTCDAQQVQLLDGTVFLRRLRPSRCDSGHFCLRRTFVFEYSTDGDNRRQGFVLMNGASVAMVGLAEEG